MLKKNTIYWYKLNAITRWLIVHGATNIFYESYIVNEYPKSGGTWLAQMLSSLLQLPFPRNQLPVLKSSIIHGHYLNSTGMKNVVIMWRDGRDILVSQYYHYLFPNDKGNHRLVEQTRRLLQFSDYNDIKSNLSKFMDFAYSKQLYPRYTWSEFVDQWADKKCIHVKYEDLLIDPHTELKKLIMQLQPKLDVDVSVINNVIEDYSFSRQKRLDAGLKNKKSFLRKGIAGDWKNHFNNSCREKFHEYAGASLIKLGYEQSNDWIFNKECNITADVSRQ